MPNANYIKGRAAEYAIMRDLKGLGFACIRAAASHGVYDVAGVRADAVVLVQAKRAAHPPAESEWRGMVDMAVPPDTLKIVLWYPDGVGAVRSAAARVLYSNAVTLPPWCGTIRWVYGLPPRQPSLRMGSGSVAAARPRRNAPPADHDNPVMTEST